jgi:hypothetical protein
MIRKEEAGMDVGGKGGRMHMMNSIDNPDTSVNYVSGEQAAGVKSWWNRSPVPVNLHGTKEHYGKSIYPDFFACLAK